MRFHTILHPTDFSNSSKQAFLYACALARDCDARLVVIHTVEPAVMMVSDGIAVPDEMEEMRELAQHQLDELQPIDPHACERVQGRPGSGMILDAADEFQADLIVMERTADRSQAIADGQRLELAAGQVPVLTVKIGPCSERQGSIEMAAVTEEFSA